jgi:hypothetical protein
MGEAMAFSFDRHLEAILLRQMGNNRKLAEEIKEKLSEESKERLFRVMQEMEDEVNRSLSRSRRFGF